MLRLFADLGARTLSADDLAREVLAKGGAAYAATIARFGQGIVKPDGEIDRSILGEIIFADPDARRDLNDLTHPHIIAAMRERVERFRAHPPSTDAVLALEVPLLIECGLQGLVDEVLVVAAEPQTQESRLTKRSGVSIEHARSRMAAQMPIERKIERADRVVYNDGSLGLLEAAVRAIWDEIHLL